MRVHVTDHFHVFHTSSRFVTGVIVREKLSVFERILWRACRGNVFLRRAEIETPLENPTTVSHMTLYSTCIVQYRGFPKCKTSYRIFCSVCMYSFNDCMQMAHLYTSLCVLYLYMYIQNVHVCRLAHVYLLVLSFTF